MNSRTNTKFKKLTEKYKINPQSIQDNACNWFYSMNIFAQEEIIDPEKRMSVDNNELEELILEEFLIYFGTTEIINMCKEKI